MFWLTEKTFCLTPLSLLKLFKSLMSLILSISNFPPFFFTFKDRLYKNNEPHIAQNLRISWK